jgi:hypothetical protein
MAVYCGLVAYGIIPTMHWVYLNGGIQAPVVQVRHAVDKCVGMNDALLFKRRKRGRPAMTCRRTLDAKLKITKMSWGEAEGGPRQTGMETCS